MAGYIGSKASVVSSGAERKKTFAITGSTTSLTGLNYTVGKVHVFQNGVRLVDGTDYTATNGTTITLTVAAQNGDNVVVISQADFQVSGAVSTSGDSMTGNLSLGDNNKAIFGAGSDLQIFHDGSHSRITDAGTGSLLIDGDEVYVRSSTGENKIIADTNGGVNLFYDNASKLATTSTGVDVTGTVTSDGLTVTQTGSTTATIGATGTSGDNDGTLIINNGGTGDGMLRFDYESNTDRARIGVSASSQNLQFYTAGNNERMRIDSSGNVLVGKNTTAIGTAGHRINGLGYHYATRAMGSNGTDPVFIANILNNDGNAIEIYKDSNKVGSIGTNGGDITIGTGDTGLKFSDASDALVPWNISSNVFRDNAIDVGHANVRFDDVYATNGTIQTSDFNEKQDIASLTATEMLVGKRISALFKTFRWKDSVAEKGDNARTHTGVIAQDVQAAFTAEGLDAGDYALFISSTWWETQTEVPAIEAVEAVEEVVDEDGNVTTEAVEAVEGKDAYTRTDTYDTEDEAPEGATSKTRLGIRYPELLSFVAAYNEQRFASIEARLTALEA